MTSAPGSRGPGRRRRRPRAGGARGAGRRLRARPQNARPPHDARDATQEVLIPLIAKLSTFRGESRFRTWVYRVAANGILDRKSTRLNSSHLVISYAVFCLKKKKNTRRPPRY